MKMKHEAWRGTQWFISQHKYGLDTRRGESCDWLIPTLPNTLATTHGQSLLIGSLLLLFIQCCLSFYLFIFFKRKQIKQKNPRNFPWRTAKQDSAAFMFHSRLFYLFMYFFSELHPVDAARFSSFFFFVSPLRSETIDWPRGLLLFCFMFFCASSKMPTSPTCLRSSFSLTARRRWGFGPKRCELDL